MAFVHALAPALPYALRSGLFAQRRQPGRSHIDASRHR
jgi:hypothetical protein